MNMTEKHKLVLIAKHILEAMEHPGNSVSHLSAAWVHLHALAGEKLIPYSDLMDLSAEKQLTVIKAADKLVPVKSVAPVKKTTVAQKLAAAKKAGKKVARRR
jgi:hypothetical protein